jgi:hypothetical protein
VVSWQDGFPNESRTEGRDGQTCGGLFNQGQRRNVQPGCHPFFMFTEISYLKSQPAYRRIGTIEAG